MTTLERCISSSYHAYGDSADLLAHLQRLAWKIQEPRSPHERARLRTRGGRLVIIYHTGTVLVQGIHQHQTHAQLRQFVVEQGALV